MSNRDTNVLAARWVEQCIWSYRREFDVTPEMLNAKHAWLYFRQLDLVASIVLNGQEIGTHNNVFYPSRLNVTGKLRPGKLRPGKNVLTVHLDSGQFWVSDKPYEGFDSQLDGKLHKRHWLRKPQSSFSWDWAPRLINVGITGDVCLEWTNCAGPRRSTRPLSHRHRRPRHRPRHRPRVHREPVNRPVKGIHRRHHRRPGDIGRCRPQARRPSL